MNFGFWLSYIIRSSRRGGGRTIFAILCVAVGVAGVVALQIASLTIQDALTSNVRAANGGDISLTTESSPLSNSDLAVFRRLQQQGTLRVWTAVSTLHGTAVGTNRLLVPFDIDVISSPPYPLGGEPTFVSPSNGHVAGLLRRSGNVLITSVLANELGVQVGSRLFVNSVGGRGLHVTVAGILSATSFSHSAAMTVNRPDAARLTSRRPQYSAVFANTVGSPNSVAGVLRADFPAATVQTVSDALQADEAQVHDFRQFLLMVGLLALLIAGIGTLNAMQSMLVRRRLEIAMLKAMGFGQLTLYGLFGGEAILIGLIGGIAGTAVGALVSKIVTGTLASALGVQVAFVLDPGTLASGIGLGIGAALIFALLPIVRAAGFRPLELLREGVTGTALSRWPQTAGLVALVLVLFATVATVTLGDLRLAVELVVIAFLIAAALTGVFAFAVFLLGKLGPPASRVTGFLVLAVLVLLTVFTARRGIPIASILALITLLWAFEVLLPESRRLALLIAVRSLSRRRARTSVTLVAFLAGVLAMSLTLTVAVSLRGQINQALEAVQSTNLVAIADATSERRVLRAAANLPGVRGRSVMTVVQTQPVRINGRSLATAIGPSSGGPAGEADEERGRQLGGVTGFNLAAGDGPSNIHLVQGRALGPADAGTNNVIVRSSLLDLPFSLKPGDTVTLRESGAAREKTVRVVGFYSRTRRIRNFSSFFTPPVYADRSFALSLGGSDAQSIVALSINGSDLTSDATKLQRGVPGALVIDIGDLAAVVDQVLGELLDVLVVITALLLGAGLAVVGNGVALAMMERRREVALYKAIGFGPNSVLRFVLTENALIGTLAGATSVLAVAIALALISRIALQQAIGFDPTVALLVLAGATGLAVLTAYITARRPVHVRPLEALRNE